jgi:hypothetical protein
VRRCITNFGKWALAYRRCELVRVNGAEMDVQFLKSKVWKRKDAASGDDTMMDA